MIKIKTYKDSHVYDQNIEQQLLFIFLLVL
jgi:hypothetical protein